MNKPVITGSSEGLQIPKENKLLHRLQEFVGNHGLWQQGLVILLREGIGDSVFLEYPGVFNRIIGLKNRGLSGKNPKSYYETFLYEVYSIIEFDHGRQVAGDLRQRKTDSPEAATLRNMMQEIISEIQRARRIAQDLRTKKIPVITSGKSFGFAREVAQKVNRVSRRGQN
ncbi:MAG: hypothetical protein HHAS10_00690 [Candidatus Altimarinota bacterium]